MPRLEDHDIQLIREKGIKEMKEQAENIVKNKVIEEDTGKIPRAGNPVYKAIHACRAGSRKELYLAHSIPREKELSQKQIDSIVNLLARWIAREYNFYMEESPAGQKKLSSY